MIIKILHQPDGAFTHFRIEGIYADDTIYGSKVIVEDKGQIVDWENGVSYPAGAYPFDITANEIASIKTPTTAN